MQTNSSTTTQQKIQTGSLGFQPKLTLGQTIDQQILQVVSSNHNEKTVRTKLIQMALSENGAVGACFLRKDVNEHWSPGIDSPSAGRLPKRTDFDEALSERCDGYSMSANVQSEALPSLDMHGLFAPIRARGAAPEILMVVAASQQNAITVTHTLQKIAAAIQLWINSQNAADSEWQVVALGAIIELVARIESQPDLKHATEETANLLANRIGCNSVAVGMVEKGRMRLKSISGVTKIDHGSDASQNYLQSMVESAARLEPAIFPPVNDDNNHMLQAHRQLAASIHSEAVFSEPLLREDGTPMGAIVLTGPKTVLSASQVQRFSHTAATPIANSLQMVSKLKRNIVSRSLSYLRNKVSAAKRWVVIAMLVGIGALMFVPVTYRVRCNCVTEPVKRRFSVAPFDGQIVVGHKEAGDFVKEGDLLAEMDGRSIRWELSGITAEREQSLRTREMELSERNIPKTILAELEYDRLVAQEAVLQYQRDHLQIKSLVDGVVLSGSLERAEAASVETGQVLFEIGPLKPMRVEIAVPDDEIAQVKTGFSVKVWIDGKEDEPIEGQIKKIHPRSETRDADNVFIAEIEFPNDEERLRPGMKGNARIDCQKRSLGWTLFHKPANYLRSRFTWW